MALYDRSNEYHLAYVDHWRAIGDRASAKIDARRKADDPLAFYWGKGVIHMREQFGKLLDFRPKPEQFYNEGKYNDGRRISNRN